MFIIKVLCNIIYNIRVDVKNFDRNAKYAEYWCLLEFFQRKFILTETYRNENEAFKLKITKWCSKLCLTVSWRITITDMEHPYLKLTVVNVNSSKSGIYVV